MRNGIYYEGNVNWYISSFTILYSLLIFSSWVTLKLRNSLFIHLCLFIHPSLFLSFPSFWSMYVMCVFVDVSDSVSLPVCLVCLRLCLFVCLSFSSYHPLQSNTHLFIIPISFINLLSTIYFYSLLWFTSESLIFALSFSLFTL